MPEEDCAEVKNTLRESWNYSELSISTTEKVLFFHYVVEKIA